MRRFIAPIAAIALLALTASPSLATKGAHFFTVIATIGPDGALTASWDEAGVGQEQVDYLLTADASATYACINGGGKHPQAANKETFSGPLASPVTTFNPENGRVEGSISLGPLGAGGFSCPSGQRLVLASVSYSNVVLSDLTNDVSYTIAGPLSRTFFNV